MRKTTFDKILELSAQETKDLTRRALKTSEEVGELAEAVLACDGPDEYKGKTYDDVLKESADVVLCAFSVALEAGFSFNDIEGAMIAKLRKWEDILALVNVNTDKGH